MYIRLRTPNANNSNNVRNVNTTGTLNNNNANNAIGAAADWEKCSHKVSKRRNQSALARNCYPDRDTKSRGEM